MENKPEDDSLESSLEGPNPKSTPANTTEGDKTEKKKKSSGKRRGFKELLGKINIYFLLFVLILLLTAMIIFIGTQQNKKELAQPTISTAELSEENIQDLSSNEATVGDPKQTLNIESNSVFAGKVLIRDSLDVAGTIKVGGSLSLPGIRVSGTSEFDQIQANNLSIAGDTSVQGSLNVLETLTVSGGGSFGGPISAPSLNVDDFQINGDLSITRHIDAGGGTPGRTNGTAVGSGGTTSVSGTDTAGTLAVNVGGGPAAGCFATINFTQSFGETPHVVVTPVGSAAGGLNWYINRSQSNFSICTTNPAPAGSNFAFDWVAID